MEIGRLCYNKQTFTDLITLAKLSLLFFFRRLIIGLPIYLRMWMITLVLVLLLYLGCMLSNLLTCTPLDKYWSASTFDQSNFAYLD